MVSVLCDEAGNFPVNDAGAINYSALEIGRPAHVQVLINRGKNVTINVNGVCVFRADQCRYIELIRD